MNVVFQGDSITDGGRCGLGLVAGLGASYPFLCMAALSAENPGAYTFYNRGIAGNRVTDLLARWKKDCLNLEPDYLSILIGVNDVGHEINEQNGVDAALFETVYDLLISEALKQNPNLKIVLMDPFVMAGSLTDEHLERFQTEVALRREAVAHLAEKYHLPVIHLQEIFEKACKQAPVSCWIGDGVHPTPAGNALIAEHWIAKFHELTAES